MSIILDRYANDVLQPPIIHLRGTPDSFITIAQDGNIFWAEKPGFGDFDAEVVFDEQGADAAI